VKKEQSDIIEALEQLAMAVAGKSVGSDSSHERLWARLPERIRRQVEDHVAANVPDNLLTKWRDQHARGVEVGSDEPTFHLGVGLNVRNLCRERLPDADMAAYGLWGEWDNYYTVVLAAVAARRH
jgi:hypothetical protein